MITKKRVFYDSLSEEKWLNSLGEKGLKLVRCRPFSYDFEETSQKWCYITEWLDSSPETEENREYIKSKEKNCFYCGKHNCYAYFASVKGNLERSEKAVEKTRKHYSAVTMFWLVITAFLTGLLIYNIIWAQKLDSLGYTTEYDSSRILSIFKGLVSDKNPARVFSWFVAFFTAASAGITFYVSRVQNKWNKKFGKNKINGETEL